MKIEFTEIAGFCAGVLLVVASSAVAGPKAYSLSQLLSLTDKNRAFRRAEKKVETEKNSVSVMRKSKTPFNLGAEIGVDRAKDGNGTSLSYSFFEGFAEKDRKESCPLPEKAE